MYIIRMGNIFSLGSDGSQAGYITLIRYRPLYVANVGEAITKLETTISPYRPSPRP